VGGINRKISLEDIPFSLKMYQVLIDGFTLTSDNCAISQKWGMVALLRRSLLLNPCVKDGVMMVDFQD
jgi:hypothetical protein